MLCASVVGTVLAHAVDYRVLFPDAAARSSYLAATGHSYWPAAVRLALAAAVVAGSAAVARGGAVARSGLRADNADPAPHRLAVLATGQAAFFVAVEATERVAARTDPLLLLRSPERRWASPSKSSWPRSSFWCCWRSNG